MNNYVTIIYLISTLIYCKEFKVEKLIADGANLTQILWLVGSVDFNH